MNHLGCEKGWEMMSSDLEIMLWRSARRVACGSLRRGRAGQAKGRGGRDGHRAAPPRGGVGNSCVVTGS